MIYIDPTDEGGDDGGGGGGNEPVALHGKPFKVSGPAAFEPSYVSQIELDLSGKSDPITDQCGRTEVRKNGDTNWTLTAEGIMSDAELSGFKSIARVSETLTVTTQLHSGQLIVDTATMTQKEEDVRIEFPNDGTDGIAIHFQLQFKEPASDEGGGVVPNFS